MSEISQFIGSSARNLVEVLRHRAIHQRDRTALTFLSNGESDRTAWTYGDLDLQARRIAALLQQHTEPGDRAVLVYSPSLDYVSAFYGCLYAGVVAVPTYSARLNRSSSRLISVLKDCEPSVVLTTSQTRRDHQALGAPNDEIQWLATDDLAPSGESAWRESELPPETIAFLQYTSGSTASPRGVVISHGNLLHNLHNIGRKFSVSEESLGVIWLPPYHDMGLIGGILQPIHAGIPVVLMPPLSFIQRPYRWLKAISEWGGTISGGPNFAYDLCVERITPEQRATLDLSSWEVAFNGAEPIRAETLERFAKTFAECGFRREALYPCYGMAESTLLVTGGAHLAGPTVREFCSDAVDRGIAAEANGKGGPRRRLVSSGIAADGLKVSVVDPETCAELGEGRVGEIWIQGPSVAKGYWCREAESSHTFEAHLATGEGPYLRTGDLGFLHDGDLFVTGRRKDLIIIRGVNYYPQDIEHTALESHDSLRGGRGAAFSIEHDGLERLVIVHEVTDRNTDRFDEIFNAIARAVTKAHDLTVFSIVLVGHHRVPKTSSGKIQRRLCRQQFADGTLTGVLQRWDAPSTYGSNGHPRPAVEPVTPEKSDQRTDQASTDGVELFELILDRAHLVDSSGMWDAAKTLEGAQEEKFLRMAELADIRPESSLLDIGCGWGGLARFAAQSLGVTRVVGLTTSEAEAHFNLSRANDAIRVVRQSWADFRPKEKFDSVVCIDALEHFVPLSARAKGDHVAQYRRFFRRARSWMTGEGKFALQTLVSTKRADSPRSYQDVAVMARMFPHSSLPLLEDITAATRGYFQMEHSTLIREDYQRTLEAWLSNLHAHREQILDRFGLAVFEQFDRYFEATLRQAEGGYIDVLQCALIPQANAPEDEEDEGARSTSVRVETEHRSFEQIQTWITEAIAEKLHLDPSEIDIRQPLSVFGLDSLAMVSLVGDLETWLGRSLSPTLAWDYPTIEAWSRHLAGESSGHAAADAKDRTAEPIAIIGMACRFPGARSLDDYWRLMIEKRDAIREIPADRWNADEYFDKDPDAPGKMVTRYGAFVDEIDLFDPQFFGISPREAARMDPQQRLLLEVAWEAVENAGLPAERINGSRTGVFVGIGGTDYSQIYRRFDNSIEYLDAYCGTGNALSIAANRISYIMDLHGPSLSVDTACSSALVAIHYAVQSLRDGDCDMALAGGVNAILSPEVTIAFSKARMLSPDGQCKTFDADANGYVRGEGCGMVLFKRLADAERDGDEILAVIRATAVNQDGRTTGITAPNGPAQQECVRKALRQARIDADDLSYIEAHGTGTPLGDPIEVQALGAVVKRSAADQPSCYLGSIKPNIGHLETASGVAGLIRVVLMMRHGVIPGQRNFTKLNPHIKLDGSRLQITSDPIAWQAADGKSRLAGVSGFGFGGTNAHLILEDHRSKTTAAVPPIPSTDRPVHLFPLAAQSDAALRAYADRFSEWIDSHPDVTVADLAHSTATTRSAFDFRLAVAATDRSELQNRLKAFATDGRSAGTWSGPIKVRSRPKIAFLFTGQGSQYFGMARELYQSQPTFRKTLDACDEILRESLSPSLLDVLFDEAHGGLIDETAYTQPALFAIEYAIATLWRSWGIEPSVVLGHSVGEYAAACIAGAVSLEDGLRVIAKRGRLMGELPHGGVMAVVFAPPEAVEPELAQVGSAVSFAAFNGPDNTVISGAASAVDEVVSRLEAREIRTQRLQVSHAFHSELLDPMLDEFQSFANKIEWHAPKIPIISNLTGEVLADGHALSGRYWRDHARQPVRFAQGMQALAKMRCDVLLEVGPHPSLIAMGRRCIKSSRQIYIPSLRKGSGDWEVLSSSVASLFVHGVAIDWRGWDRDHSRRRVPLPTYPFQRRRYWMDEDPDKKSSVAFAQKEGSHPLLGSKLGLAVATKVFGSQVSTRSVPSLADHVVQGSVVLPGAAYLETALAACDDLFGAGIHTVENVSFQQPLFMEEGKRHAVQVVVTPEVAGSSSFQFMSDSAENAEAYWMTHASAILRRSSTETTQPTRAIPLAIQENPDLVHDRAELYAKLKDRGLEYGERFQPTAQIWKRGQETLARIGFPEGIRDELAKFRVHPAILDGAIQTLGAAIPEELIAGGTGETYLPTGVTELRAYASPTEASWVHARLCTDFATEGIHRAEGDVWILDDAGNVLVELLGVALTRIGTSRRDESTTSAENWVYQLEWSPAPAETTAEPAARRWVVISDSTDLVAKSIGDACVAERATLTRGGDSILTPASRADFESLLASVPVGEKVSILFSSLAQSASSAPDQAFAAVTSLLHLTQAIENAPVAEVVIVTRGAISRDGHENVDPAASSLWGMGRVLVNERLDMRTRLIDLPRDATAEDIALATIEVRESEKAEVLIRAGQRWTPRLIRKPELLKDNEAKPARDRKLRLPRGGAYRLEVASTATLDRLSYRPFNRGVPGAGAIAVEVAATGLNFSDVLKAMGLYPGLKPGPVPIGIECAGRVSAVGEGVTQWAIGDRVLGVAPFSFASHAITSANAVIPMPEGVSFEDAATIPIAYLTAYYGLVELARVAPGEKVLIHAAAGGVGLAAIQICQLIGAEVFATAGSDEKREYLRSLGVRHIFNSRTLEFAEQIREVTHRAGVDIVLNSLPGEAIPKSVECLAAYGRFLEIGKTDIYQNRGLGLFPFQNNLSYFAIDLDKLLRERPMVVRRMFEKIAEHLSAGELKPLPKTVFAADEAVQAFRYMAQRKNTGKVIVTYDVPNQTDGRAEGAYWVTGGLGGLGLEVARSLVDRGAADLVLFGRSEPSDLAKQAIEQFEQKGTRVSVLRVDVSQREALQEAISRLPSSAARPVGIYHAAGVLDDGVMSQQTAERFERVLAPKVRGAWNLHELSREEPLDEFVLFSSVATIFGSPGQSSYSAGNAFLDGLAAHRRSLGLPALSINWGPWGAIGMAARLGEEKLEARGLGAIPPDKGIEVLARLAESDASQVVVADVNWSRMLGLYPSGPPATFEHLVDASEDAPRIDRELRSKVLSTPAAERPALLQSFFIEQIARVMELDAARIDPEQPMNTLGLDSLMAIELKNGIEATLGVTLPMAKFLEGPSAVQLSQLANSLLAGVDDPKAPVESGG